MADVARYFNGRLNPDDTNRMCDDLMGAEKKLNPDKSDADIYRELNTHKNS